MIRFLRIPENCAPTSENVQNAKTRFLKAEACFQKAKIPIYIVFRWLIVATSSGTTYVGNFKKSKVEWPKMASQAGKTAIGVSNLDTYPTCKRSSF